MRLIALLVVFVIGLLGGVDCNRRHPPWILLKNMVSREIRIVKHNIEELEWMEDDEDGLDEMHERHLNTLQEIETELKKLYKAVRKQWRNRYCDRDKFFELDDDFRDMVDQRVDLVDEVIDQGFRGLQTWRSVKEKLDQEEMAITKIAAYR